MKQQGPLSPPQAIGVLGRVHKCTPCLHAWLEAGLGRREGQAVAAASGKKKGQMQRALGITRAGGSAPQRLRAQRNPGTSDGWAHRGERGGQERP